MSQPSLRGRLRWLIIGVMLAVLLPLAVLSFRRTMQEVNELSDGRLAQSARTLQVILDQEGPDARQRPEGRRARHVHGREHAAELLLPRPVETSGLDVLHLEAARFLRDHRGHACAGIGEPPQAGRLERCRVAFDERPHVKSSPALASRVVLR